MKTRTSPNNLIDIFVGVDIGKSFHCAAAINSRSNVLLKPLKVIASAEGFAAFEGRLRQLGEKSAPALIPLVETPDGLHQHAAQALVAHAIDGAESARASARVFAWTAANKAADLAAVVEAVSQRAAIAAQVFERAYH